MKIMITGASGFVGKNLTSYLNQHVENLEIESMTVRYGAPISIQAQAYIHLAAKAHDIKNVTEEKEYLEANFLLTKDLYNVFLQDKTASCFIYVSSIKSVADKPKNVEVGEDYVEIVKTIYGRSKKLAEDYIISNRPKRKQVYILRPCMIHGPGNKGNLNLLYKLVSRKIPWPLGAYQNRRSFLSIENFCFAVAQLLKRSDIPGGVYHIADTQPLSTNELISLIQEELKIKSAIWRFPTGVINTLAKIGDILHLPLNTERLQKLTENYVVSNEKLLKVLGCPLPIDAKEGIRTTIRSFMEQRNCIASE